ncbi:hypothetical protein HanIR_Chr16g0814581 [Helianthus annuus]|nr:hypothetical protein HanIR_Chr16g0814581 [Helianthus annuus]
MDIHSKDDEGKVQIDKIQDKVEDCAVAAALFLAMQCRPPSKRKNKAAATSRTPVLPAPDRW